MFALVNFVDNCVFCPFWLKKLVFNPMASKRIFLALGIFSLLFCLGMSNDLHAQKKKKNKNKGEKTEYKGSPEKIMKEADELFQFRNFVEAEKAYKAVLAQEPNNYMATLRVARCNWYIQEYDEAVNYFESALIIDENANDTVFFDLAVAYKKLNRYSDARETFKKFQTRWKYTDEFARRAKLEVQGCDFAEEKLKKDPLWTVKTAPINTAAGDNSPALLRQNEVDSFIVFTSHRNESMGNEEFNAYGEIAYSDLYIVKMDNDSVFGVVENMGKKINTNRNDGTAAFTKDGLKMYYSICNTDKSGYGCSIYESEYDPRKKGWGKPQLIEDLQGQLERVVKKNGKTKLVPTYDVQPTLSEDGNTMYFISDRDGGMGRQDVWYSVREGEGWSQPVNAGRNVNTPYNELSPYLSRDGSRLYFSTEGRIGFGGLDLFYAEGSDGNFSEPVNLGSPINSSYDDWGGIWLNKDSTAMFTSDRPNTDGGRDDIYVGKLIPPPPCEFQVHGVIRNKDTKQPVAFATAILFQFDFEGDLIPLDTFKTDQDARYNFPLEGEKEYKIIANAPEYLANEAEISTKDIKDCKDADIEQNIDILLEQIQISIPFVINNIFYDFDESFLREESKTELDRLIKLLTQNDNIMVEIGSHTDTNGSEPYNKRLSEERAKSVLVYLLENGITPERLNWFGYGETVPKIFPELSDEDEQLNRRSEFTIQSIRFGD